MTAMLLGMHEAGDTVGAKYRIAERLREDASGSVYVAIALDGEKEVLLKEIDAGKLREGDGAAKDLFEPEAKAFRDLFHPGIPTALDAFEADGRFYLVQARDDGKSMATLIADDWKAAEPELKRIAKESLAALAYLHTRKPAVVHGEITPDTLVREEDGRVHLVGFPMVQTGLTEAVARRTSMGPAADLLALGHTLVFVVSGKSGRVDIDKLHVSADLRAWLKKMTDTSAAARFATVQEAQDALAALRTQRKPQRPPSNTLFMVILALLGIGGAVLYMRERDRGAEDTEEKDAMRAMMIAVANSDASHRPDPQPPPPPKPTAKPPPLTVQPIVRWAFDEKCATTAVPADGQLHIEARAKGPVGCSGLGASFGADAGWFEAADAPALHLKDAITVAAWITPNGIDTSQAIVNKWQNKDAFALYVNGGELGFSIATSDGTPHDVFATAFDGKLTHVVGVFDGKEMRLYVDGRRAANAAVSGTIQDSARPLAIGGAAWNGFDGVISDVRIYGVAFGDAEVASLYAEREL